MKLLFTLTLALCAALNCFSQTSKTNTSSSVIKSSKTVLLKHNNDKADSLQIPVVAARYPQLQKALSERMLLDGRFAKAVADTFASTGMGITHLDFSVSFENDDVISVILNYETMGAYPSSYTKWLNLDKRTGKHYPLEDELTAKGMDEILKQYKAMLRTSILNEKKAGKGEAAQTYKTLIESLNRLTVKDLSANYIFTKTGINFRSEDVLGHAYRNMEPNREWLVPYKRLKIYLSPKSIIVKKLSLN